MNYKLLLLFSSVLCLVFISEGKSITFRNYNNAISTIQKEEKTITDETLIKLFDKLKEFAGNDFHISSQNVFTNSTLIYINGTVSDVHVIDPSAYTVSEAHADMENLEFNVNIEYQILNITGNYDLLADNDMFHLIGNGSLSVNITKPQITVAWKFNLTKEETIEVQYFDFNYIVPDIKVYIANLGGDEEVSQTLNDLINVALPSIINVTKGDIEKMVNQIVQHYSLFFLTGMTVDQFVEHVYQIIDL
ncbi:hypothetical protein O3M35_008592 [Rhynocoris fuscipes]